MKHYFWLLFIVCSTVLADTIPEPGLATPAYIPPPPVLATTPAYIPQESIQTVYYNQPIYTTPSKPVQQTVYYNQTQPTQMSRYERFAIEREQMFGNMYIRR